MNFFEPNKTKKTLECAITDNPVSKCSVCGRDLLKEELDSSVCKICWERWRDEDLDVNDQ